jgi:hypothetical protein
VKIKNMGVKFRYVTEITKEYRLLKTDDGDICWWTIPLSGVKGNFEIADRKEYVDTSTLQEAEPVAELIYSNVKQSVEQEQRFWDLLEQSNAGRSRIREMEKGILNSYTTDIVRNPYEVQKLWNLEISNQGSWDDLFYCRCILHSNRRRGNTTFIWIGKKWYKYQLLCPQK